MPWANIVASRIKLFLCGESRTSMSGLYRSCIGRLVLKPSYIIVMSGWVMYCFRFSDGLSVGLLIVGLAAYFPSGYLLYQKVKERFLRQSQGCYDRDRGEPPAWGSGRLVPQNRALLQLRSRRASIYGGRGKIISEEFGLWVIILVWVWWLTGLWEARFHGYSTR